MTYFGWTLFAVLSLVAPYCQSQDLSSVLKALGWKNCVIIGDFWDSIDLLKAGSGHDVSISFAPMETNLEQYSDEYLVIMEETEKSIELLKKVLLQKRRARSVMIVAKNGTNFDLLETQMKSFNLSRAFYIFENGQVTDYQTFRDQDVMVSRQSIVDRATGFIKFKRYNLQGAHLSILTGSWMPWLGLFNCTDGKNCETKGILKQAFNILAQRYNFTWKVDETSNWGVRPATGGFYDDNATFVGAYGSAVNDEYDTPLSVWGPILERFLWTDITLSVNTRISAVLINTNMPPVDVTLFLRPFTYESWGGICVVLAIIIVFILGPSLVLPYINPDWISMRIVTIFSWIFFLLTNAFYGGALTMFFSSAPSLPFSNMRQGLDEYPDWKMIYVAGNDVMISIPAEAGDERLKTYWDLVSSEEGKYLIQPSVSAALEKLQEPGYFYLSGELAATMLVYRQLRLDNLKVHVVSYEDQYGSGFIFPKYSPLTEMLNEGILYLKSSGIMKTLENEGFESISPSGSSSSENGATQILSLQHTGLILGVYSLALFLSLSIFMAEGTLKYTLSYFSSVQESQKKKRRKKQNSY